MNNKGQSLIAFILLLPVIFLFITGLWEIGNLAYINSKNDFEVKSALKYGLKNIDDENINEKLITILDKNIDGANEVTVGDNEIIIRVSYKYKSIFSDLIKKNNMEYKYIGKKEKEKIIIEKEG